jgi:sugar phosphate isomerase/epimerase
MNWYRRADPNARIPYAAVSVTDCLRICEQLPVESMTALADLDAFAGLADVETLPTGELVEPFARLCDQAAHVGATVHLEFIPSTVVPDVRTAWQIVREAGRGNGGIVFDSWHFYRGHPDLDALRAIPGDRVFAVQLSDAPTRPRGVLMDDTMRRQSPGDGSFDLVGVIRALAEIGGMHGVGAEVISPELAAMDPARAARLANDCVRRLVTMALWGQG